MLSNLFSIRLAITALCFSFAVTLAGCNQSANNQPVNGSTTPVNSTTSQTRDRSTKSSANQSTASAVSETSEETAVAQTRPNDQKQETAFLDGRYLVGHTGQGLQIEGDRYRFDDEEGEKPWRSITELQSIKEGVIYDGNAYWCLNSMKSKDTVGSCSENGWVMYQPSGTPKKEPQAPATEKGTSTSGLPFIGRRFFNFLGGSGTGYSITIAADGDSVIRQHGTMESTTLYQGPFQETMTIETGQSITFKDGYASSCTEKTYPEESAPCRAKLYE